jgi:hypothetical protein
VPEHEQPDADGGRLEKEAGTAVPPVPEAEEANREEQERKEEDVAAGYREDDNRDSDCDGKAAKHHATVPALVPGKRAVLTQGRQGS